MAEKISIQIALAGGDELLRQLSDIGEAGQKAFLDIAQAAEKVGGFQNLDPTEITAALEKFGVTGADAIKKITDAVKSATQLETVVNTIRGVENHFISLGNTINQFSIRMARSLGPIGVFARALGPVGVAFGFVAEEAVRAGFSVEKSIADINEQATKLGLTTQQFDKVRGSFETFGISSNSIADGMQHLQGVLDKLNLDRVNKSIADLQQIVDTSGKSFLLGSTKLEFLKETADGVGPAADAARAALQKLGQISPFKPLADSLGPVQKLLTEAGLSVAEFSQTIAKTGKATPEQIQAIINALKKIPDEVTRSQVAASLFGNKLGRELVNALRLGGTALDNFKSKFAELTQEQIDQAARQEQAINLFLSSWERFRRDILAPITMPIITFGANLLTKELDGIRKGIRDTIDEFNRLKRVFQFFIDNPTLTVELLLKMTGFTGAFEQFQRQWQFFKDNPGLVLEMNFNELIEGAKKAWEWIKPFTGKIDAAVFRFLAEQADAAWEAIKAGASATHQWLVENVGGPVAGAWEWLVTGFNDVVAQIKASDLHQWLVETVGAPVAGAWQWLVDTFNTVIAQLPALGQSIATAISTLVTTPVAGAWQWLVTTLDGVLAQLKAKIDAFFNSLKQQAGQGIASGSEFGGLGDTSGNGGLAGGGLIGGRGTGTSDSNLAWVSRGEHIMPALAVRQPGVLAFLEALRRSGGDLRRVLDGMGRFALGGMVMPRTVPVFAAGGLNTGSHVTINFPGLPPIVGLRASANTVEELRRAAAMAQVRSGGRKPSRYS